jgi:hypothetical protein
MGSVMQARSWTTSIDGEFVHVPKKLAHCFASIANAPPFSGLRRFPKGRGFKQWTGNDSKALMKVSSKLTL